MPDEDRSEVFRPATKDDVKRIVELLADDVLGREREAPFDPLPTAYREAFDAIEADANQELIVAESDGVVVGTLQLTFIPYLTHRGSWRAQIEGVRVDASHRNSGVGRRMLLWAIDRAGRRRCRLVQLTTDRSRPDALRFYESLGFRPTHDGLKLALEPPDAQQAAEGRIDE